MSSQVSQRIDVGGLCHLVEAATALSKLVEALSPSPSTSEEPRSVERSIISDDEASDKNKTAARPKRDIFPQRLHAILADPTLADVCTWLPNGRSFVILNPDKFVQDAVSKYLPQSKNTKFPSLCRKLNRWGFRQITKGSEAGAFHHPLFTREEPHRCLGMVCQRGRDRRRENKSSTASTVSTTSSSSSHRSLPLKKRGFSQQALQPILPCVSGPKKHVASSASVAVSVDDSTSTSSVSSSSSSRSATKTPSPPTTVATPQEIAPAPVVASTNTVLRPNGYVSKDPTLVAQALRQSEQNERIHVAKAMLYHAYMQALNDGSR